MRGVASIPCLVVLAAAGCATETVKVDHLRGRFVDPGPAGKAVDRCAAVLPVGSVPYDNRSLPLVSPAGDLVATQAGLPPDWPTILAEPGGVVPRSTRVEVYRLDRREGRTDRVAATEWGILLGRGGDTGGFLVESPRPGGARWIGYAGWETGEIEWRVSDGQVNAFASLGPDGGLAWSRRGPGAEHFDLVVRRGGEEWTVGSQGGDWLMPAWSADPDGLFALRLHDGRLEAAFMSVRGPEATGRTIVRLPLGGERTMHDAYQCLSGHVIAAGASAVEVVHLLLWHPSAGRIALWEPGSSPGAATLLDEGSIAAVIDPTGHVLVTTDDMLLLHDLVNAADRRPLLHGTHVPRPIAGGSWPYLLMSPSGDRIDLTLMRLAE